MKKIIGLLSLFTCLMTTAAISADNYCYDRCDYDSCCSDRCGFYTGLTAGANWLNITGHSSKLNVGFLLSAQVGYKLPTGPRLEGEFAFRRNKWKNDKGYASSLAYMANVYQDFNMCCLPFTPYLGAGIGASHLKARACHINGSTGFAWQVMGGASTCLCENIDIALEYKYFRGKQNASNQSVGLNLKYFF